MADTLPDQWHSRLSDLLGPRPAASVVVTDATGAFPGDQQLSALSTGLVKVTTGTGILSNAVAGTDYLAPRLPVGTEYEFFDMASATPGAITVAKMATEFLLHASNTGTWTLGSGTVDGQEKRISTVGTANTAAITITGAFRFNGTAAGTSIVMNAGNQGLTLFWSVSLSKWQVRQPYGPTGTHPLIA